MTRPALLLTAALLLAAVPAAAQTQDRARQAGACRNEAERFAATFTAPDRAGRGAGTADTAVPAPSVADAERDMARRGGVLTPAPLGSGTQQGVDAAPGARAGATLSDGDRRRMQQRVDEARAAADRGDDEGCLRHLREARMAARDSGFGGGAGGSTASGGRGGGASGSGSLNTNTAGSRPPGAPGAAGSNAGSLGGAAGSGAGGSGGSR